MPGPLHRDRARIVFDCRMASGSGHDGIGEFWNSMMAGERDKKMDEIATKAATEYCRNHQNDTDEQIRFDPETYLKHSIPYLTVRTLHRLEADSGWIKAFAIITGVLTFALLALTAVLAIYALRLDKVIHSLSQ